MLDKVSGRLKYQYIERDSTSSQQRRRRAERSRIICCVSSAFDLPSSTTNQVKLYLDWTPAAASACRSSTVQGQRLQGHASAAPATRRNEVLPERQLDRDQRGGLNAVRPLGEDQVRLRPPQHRQSGACDAAARGDPNCYDPSPAVQQSQLESYNWDSQTKDKNWMVGVGADWQAMEKLKLSGSYLMYDEGDGTFDMTSAAQLRQSAAAADRQLRTASSNRST